MWNYYIVGNVLWVTHRVSVKCDTKFFWCYIYIPRSMKVDSEIVATPCCGCSRCSWFIMSSKLRTPSGNWNWMGRENVVVESGHRGIYNLSLLTYFNSTKHILVTFPAFSEGKLLWVCSKLEGADHRKRKTTRLQCYKPSIPFSTTWASSSSTGKPRASGLLSRRSWLHPFQVLASWKTNKLNTSTIIACF